MIEVLKQTMEALERSVATCFDQYAHQQVMSQPDHFINQAIASLRQAIAHFESQEPVALESFIKWDEDVEPVGEVVGFIQDSNYIMVKMHDEKQISLNDELYIHPPQRTWQGLTQSDFNEIYDLFANKVSSDFIFEKMYSTIEAKLKQKNGFAEEKNT